MVSEQRKATENMARFLNNIRRLIRTKWIVILFIICLLYWMMILKYPTDMTDTNARLEGLEVKRREVPVVPSDGRLKEVEEGGRVMAGDGAAGPPPGAPQAIGGATDTAPETAFTRVQRSRLQTMHNVCETFNSTTEIGKEKGTFSHVVVDDHREFLYCRIFKVSSSTMRKFLLSSSGRLDPNAKFSINDPRWMARKGFKDLNKYTYERIMYRIIKYYKFIFVRNPLKRLISAYRDKFFGTHPDNIRVWQKGHGIRIIKKYRDNPSKESLKKGHDVRFEEFLRYVIDTRANPDGHWRTYVDNCNPCIINYDFIGKLETMTEDARFIADKISVDKDVPFPAQWMGPSAVNSQRTNGSTDDVYLELYKSVSKDVLHKILNIYEQDMKLFGYDIEPELLS